MVGRDMSDEPARYSMIERINLTRQPLLAQPFAERVVDASQPSERFFIAKQVQDSGLLLERCRDHDQQLATCMQLGQTDLEVLMDRVKLARRQKPVLECLFTEAAQQRTPVIVRTERMIRNRIVILVVPSNGQFSVKRRPRLVHPQPMAPKARETNTKTHHK